MEASLVLFTFNLLAYTSIEIGESFHVSRSNGVPWTHMECLGKQLEVYDTRGNR